MKQTNYLNRLIRYNNSLFRESVPFIRISDYYKSVQIGILLTDGRSNSGFSVYRAARQVKDAGINMFVVGITNKQVSTFKTVTYQGNEYKIILLKKSIKLKLQPPTIAVSSFLCLFILHIYFSFLFFLSAIFCFNIMRTFWYYCFK